jgi:hypothetical protein
MKLRDNRYIGYLIFALTIFVVSPIDDFLVTALFGTALFGFGNSEFYVFLVLTMMVSVLIWKKNSIEHLWKTHQQ